MSEIKINDKHNIKGKVSLVNELDDSSSPAVISYSGVLSTDLYIENIDKIETDKFIINGVRVYYESIGSETGEVLYQFTAMSVEIDEGIKLR